MGKAGVIGAITLRDRLLARACRSGVAKAPLLPIRLGLLAFLAWGLLFPGVAAAADSPYNCDAAEAKSPSTDMTITLDPATSWQPRGGQIRIVVESKTQTLKDTDVAVCFRWSGADEKAHYLPHAALQVVDFVSNDNSGKGVYSVTVPQSLERVSFSWFDRLWGKLPEAKTQPTRFDNGMIVPVADVKVIVGKSSNSVLATAVLHVGITSIWTAFLTTLVCVVIAHALLYAWAMYRNVPGRSPWMRLVSTREGYASLSQLQIMLWSFLFGAGAVYVMSLSGSLINIPTSALVLLGIAGATTLGARIQGANAQAPAQPTADLPAADAAPGSPQNVRVTASTDHSITLEWDMPAAGAPPAVYAVSYARQGFADWQVSSDRIKETSYRVVRLLPDTAYVFQVVALNAKGSSQPAQVSDRTKQAAVIARRPVWSDLVVTPQHPGEIDVTRVQMLFFTLISAAFVAIKLVNGNTIPDIPDGFMLLMGISNGVYLSAKFVPD
jgi:Fibronectin type III domain